MRGIMKTAGISLAVLAALALAPMAVHAQVVRVYSTPAVVSPPPVTYYSYYQPVVPSTVYYSYYQPLTTVYSAPVPVTYSYYAPTTAYSAPAVYTPGTITTRSYYGLGIFRPRGWTTEQYFTPAAVPVTSYYTPVFVR